MSFENREYRSARKPRLTNVKRNVDWIYSWSVYALIVRYETQGMRIKEFYWNDRTIRFCFFRPAWIERRSKRYK